MSNRTLENPRLGKVDRWGVKVPSYLLYRRGLLHGRRAIESHLSLSRSKVSRCCFCCQVKFGCHLSSTLRWLASLEWIENPGAPWRGCNRTIKRALSIDVDSVLPRGISGSSKYFLQIFQISCWRSCCLLYAALTSNQPGTLVSKKPSWSLWILRAALESGNEVPRNIYKTRITQRNVQTDT
jgi:hypothetical protein